MELAKIEHYRCGEPKERTYVWVPSDMTVQELSGFIDRARQETIEAERNVNGEQAPKYQPWYVYIDEASKQTGFMDTTLAELKAAYGDVEANYNAWAAKRDAARKTFAERLKAVSNGRVSLFHEEECEFELTCDWGHNHGVRVDYGETDI